MPRLDLSRRQVIAGLAATAGTALLAPRFGLATEGSAIIGEVTRTKSRAGDTLMDIMRRYNLGFDEILAANPGFDIWTPAEGTDVVLPTAHILPDGPREGMVLNLPEHRLYFYPPKGGKPESYAIGIGTEANKTPLGRTKVVRKQKKPTWYVPKSILAEEPGRKPVVPPGPDNPLGDHAIYLAWNAYLIHGTNLPDAIGRRASHGCINMYPEGIEAIFDRTPIGMQVAVVDQQAKFAWVGDQLFMQVHLTGRQADQIEETGRFDHEPVPKLEALADKVAGREKHRLDWEAIVEAVKKRDGIPVSVLRDTPA